MKTTTGTIKSLDLTKRTFTIEPIAVYKFAMDEDDESNWEIIFKDTDTAVNELVLCNKGAEFEFGRALTSAMVMLKQSKTKIEIQLSDLKPGAGNVNKPAKIVIL